MLVALDDSKYYAVYPDHNLEANQDNHDPLHQVIPLGNSGVFGPLVTVSMLVAVTLLRMSSSVYFAQVELGSKQVSHCPWILANPFGPVEALVGHATQFGLA